jgi:hypothetical protein
MDVDEHMPANRLADSRVLDFAGLKDDVPVRQDDRGTAQASQQLEGPWEQPIGERVVHEEGGHGQQLHLARVLDPEALESADVVSVAKLGKKVFENTPIALARGDAEAALEMILQVPLDPVVVKQRIVNVDEEDKWLWARGAAIERGMPGRPVFLPFAIRRSDRRCAAAPIFSFRFGMRRCHYGHHAPIVH